METTKIGNTNGGENAMSQEEITMSDERCDCCMRHIGELTPFNKDRGEFLIPRWRPTAGDFIIMEEYSGNSSAGCGGTIGTSKGIEGAMAEFFADQHTDKWEEMEKTGQLSLQVNLSHECRECLNVEGYEYYKRHWQALMRLLSEEKISVHELLYRITNG